MNRRSALGCFALLIIAAPLLFGAVDRAVQIALVLILAIGLMLFPPVLPAWSRGQKILGVVTLGLLIASQFVPAAWFGPTDWRTVLSESFGVTLPPTHHPEPARALDLLLVGLVGACWFLWVRTLTADRANRPPVAWILFASGVIVATVSLLAPGGESEKIYGLRATLGWSGFGPFPNRNHTADFLAMSMVIGAGCLVRAGMKKDPAGLLGGVLGMGVIFVGLLESKSRGGLLALMVGLGIFAVCLLAQARGKKVLGIVASSFLVVLALLLALGPKVLDRFYGGGEGGIPANIRWAVWRDALAMWKDAPVFGHGLGSFPLVFPIYQKIDLVDVFVLHPESSWLQWLTEFGALPLALLILLGSWLLIPGLRGRFRSGEGLPLRAAALGAFGVILIHSFIDVPAHRWGTAAFALAAVALLSPGAAGAGWKLRGKGLSLLPLAVAGWWSLVYFSEIKWSPVVVDVALAENNGPARQSLQRLRQAARHFPLNPSLQQALALRELAAGQPGAGWQHARVANRLMPGSWSYPAAQASASRLYSPSMALYFWAVAVERAGFREESVFENAFTLTADLPTAESFWARFAETNPRFLLLYAALLSNDAAGRYYFDLWIHQRAPESDLRDYEIKTFYTNLPRWGGVPALEQWMKLHPDWARRDFRAWAALLHYWGLDQRAWDLLAAAVPRPDYPHSESHQSLEILEAKWLNNPADVMNALALARHAEQNGAVERAQNVILTVAARPDSPGWFLTRAAYLLAAESRFPEAVEMMLRQK